MNTTTTEMSDGIIEPGSERGTVFGFTAEKFDGWFWKLPGKVIVSFIQSKTPGEGHFKALVNTILENGFSVEIPTPLGRMQAIVKKWGFTQEWVFDATFGEHVEIWKKSPAPE